MSMIEEILKLPEEEQVAIMEAIQNNLDDFEDDYILSDEHLSFVRERIQSIENSNQQTYSWQQIKEELKTRWNTQ